MSGLEASRSNRLVAGITRDMSLCILQGGGNGCALVCGCTGAVSHLFTLGGRGQP